MCVYVVGRWPWKLQSTCGAGDLMSQAARNERGERHMAGRLTDREPVRDQRMGATSTLSRKNETNMKSYLFDFDFLKMSPSLVVSLVPAHVEVGRTGWRNWRIWNHGNSGSFTQLESEQICAKYSVLCLHWWLGPALPTTVMFTVLLRDVSKQCGAVITLSIFYTKSSR